MPTFSEYRPQNTSTVCSAKPQWRLPHPLSHFQISWHDHNSSKTTTTPPPQHHPRPRTLSPASSEASHRERGTNVHCERESPLINEQFFLSATSSLFHISAPQNNKTTKPPQDMPHIIVACQCPQELHSPGEVKKCKSAGAVLQWESLARQIQRKIKRWFRHREERRKWEKSMKTPYSLDGRRFERTPRPFVSPAPAPYLHHNFDNDALTALPLYTVGCQGRAV